LRSDCGNPPESAAIEGKVRENDGVQLGFRFKFVVFCLGLFFLCFLCFRRSGSPVLRVEKKKRKKSARRRLWFEWQYLVADMPFIGRG